MLIPQVKIRLDYEQAARYGVAPGNLLRGLEQMIEGEKSPRSSKATAASTFGALAGVARGPQAPANPADRDADRLRALSKIA